VKKFAAVTESLLPFINGPSRLSFVNKLLTAHLLNAKRYNKRFSQIFHLPDPANFFKAKVIFSPIGAIPKSVRVMKDLKKLYLTHKASYRSYFLNIVLATKKMFSFLSSSRRLKYGNHMVP